MKKISSSGEQVGGNEAGHQSDKENYSKPEINHIEGTPFATVKRGDKYIAIFGNHMITAEEFDSHEKAERAVNHVDWQMILNVIAIYVESVDKIKNVSLTKEE